MKASQGTSESKAPCRVSDSGSPRYDDCGGEDLDGGAGLVAGFVADGDEAAIRLGGGEAGGDDFAVDAQGVAGAGGEGPA